MSNWEGSYNSRVGSAHSDRVLFVIQIQPNTLKVAAAHLSEYENLARSLYHQSIMLITTLKRERSLVFLPSPN